MGTVSTDRVINEAWVIENHSLRGSFQVWSREQAQTITVAIQTIDGVEPGITLVHAGDGCERVLKEVVGITISAETYPAHIAINFTTMDLKLIIAPYLAGSSSPQLGCGDDSPGTTPIVVTPGTGTPTPPATQTQGVFTHGAIPTTSITPALPVPTTPGNLLLSISLMYGGTSNCPAADGSTPVFLGPAWTFKVGKCQDQSGDGVGGLGAYAADCATCSPLGYTLAIFYRFVGVAEVTTTPVTMQTGVNVNHTNWLYELPTTSTPGAVVSYSANLTPTTPATATMPALAGNVLGIFCWCNGAGHFATPTPISSILTAGTLIHQGRASSNDFLVPAASNQNDAWFQLARTSASVQIVGKVDPGTPAPFPAPWPHFNVGGVAIALPVGIVVPEIPYPANSVLVP